MIGEEWLFNHLFVSAPNNLGGLYACMDGQVLPMDDRPICGINWSARSGMFLRAIQQGDILSVTTSDGTREHAGTWGDIHDVLLDGEEDIYLVSTQHNAVVRWNSAEAREIERWTFADPEDSWHVNCVGRLRGELCVTAFGDFSVNRGYKNATLEQGFLRGLHRKSSLATVVGLSQPHSILESTDGWYLCNSETGEVWYASGDGFPQPRIALGGYTRGLAIRDGVLYVGLSASRNGFEEQSAGRAQVVAIDTADWREISRMPMPSMEVYGIIAMPDRNIFLSVLAQVLSGERFRLLRQRNALLESLAMRTNENVKLKMSLGLPIC